MFRSMLPVDDIAKRIANLSPEKKPLNPASSVGKAILSQFSSVDEFKKQFLDAAAKVSKSLK